MKSATIFELYIRRKIGKLQRKMHDLAHVMLSFNYLPFYFLQ